MERTLQESDKTTKTIINGQLDIKLEKFMDKKHHTEYWQLDDKDKETFSIYLRLNVPVRLMDNHIKQINTKQVPK